MKHLLNNLTEQEKKSILSQHKGSIKVVTESFFKNINAKSGNVRPLMEQEPEPKAPEPKAPEPKAPEPQIQKTFPFYVKLKNRNGKEDPYDVTKLYGTHGFQCQFGVKLRGTDREYSLFYNCSNPFEVTIQFDIAPQGGSPNEEFTMSELADKTFKYHCECEGKYVQNTKGSSRMS